MNITDMISGTLILVGGFAAGVLVTLLFSMLLGKKKVKVEFDRGDGLRGKGYDRAYQYDDRYNRSVASVREDLPVRYHDSMAEKPRPHLKPNTSQYRHYPEHDYANEDNEFINEIKKDMGYSERDEGYYSEKTLLNQKNKKQPRERDYYEDYEEQPLQRQPPRRYHPQPQYRDQLEEDDIISEPDNEPDEDTLEAIYDGEKLNPTKEPKRKIGRPRK